LISFSGKGNEIRNLLSELNTYIQSLKYVGAIEMQNFFDVHLTIDQNLQILHAHLNVVEKDEEAI